MVAVVTIMVRWRKDLTGWVARDWFAKVLLKAIVGELKSLFRAVRPKVAVHGPVAWLAVLVDALGGGDYGDVVGVVATVKGSSSQQGCSACLRKQREIGKRIYKCLST